MSGANQDRSTPLHYPSLDPPSAPACGHPSAPSTLFRHLPKAKIKGWHANVPEVSDNGHFRCAKSNIFRTNPGSPFFTLVSKLGGSARIPEDAKKLQLIINSDPPPILDPLPGITRSPVRVYRDFFMCRSQNSGLVAEPRPTRSQGEHGGPGANASGPGRVFNTNFTVYTLYAGSG